MFAWLKLVALVAIVGVIAVFWFGHAPKREAPQKIAPEKIPEKEPERRKTQVYVITSEGRRFLVFESWSGDIEVFMMDGWIAGEQM